jgi:hypothetical protein
MSGRAISLLELAFDIHKASNRGELKVKSTYEAMVQLARAQLKRPRFPFSEDEIRGLLLKPELSDREDVARDDLKKATDAVWSALRRRKSAKERLHRVLAEKARKAGLPLSPP